jgi:hypothetical protein
MKIKATTTKIHIKIKLKSDAQKPPVEQKIA